MAATTLAEGGDRQSSRQLWQQLYDTTDDTWVRDNAQMRLAQLKALDDIDALALMVRRHTEARGGRRPTGTNWSRRAGSRASRSTRRERRMS